MTTWYVRVLTKKKEEIISSAVFAILFAATVSVWYFFTGKGYEWQSISPVEQPGLFPRLLYSALVFVTLGAFLYSLGFYKFLYSIFRGTRDGWRDYKQTKREIWTLLILVMYFVIVPFVVHILNAALSFVFNIYKLVLYLFPPLGIAALVFGIGYYVRKKYQN